LIWLAFAMGHDCLTTWSDAGSDVQYFYRSLLSSDWARGPTWRRRHHKNPRVSMLSSSDCLSPAKSSTTWPA
jgi:hypothetical protein